MVYDVAHNLGKVEKHRIDGKERELVLHRKGATRAFGAGRPEVPAMYRHIGQPVLIPQDGKRRAPIGRGRSGYIHLSD
jgi:tRNA-splicing ligase RtcB